MKQRKVLRALFFAISLANFLVSVERLVFDVLGEMWVPMLVDGMAVHCALLAMVGAIFGKKMAIGCYIAWGIGSIGINIVIVLIYENVGLLKGKENDLGLTIGNQNWWRHFCRENNTDATSRSKCIIPYNGIELAHAAVYITVNVFAVVLAIALMCPSNDEATTNDTDSFSYISFAAPKNLSTQRQTSRRIVVPRIIQESWL